MESKGIPRKPPKSKLRKKIGFFRWTWNLARIKYIVIITIYLHTLKLALHNYKGNSNYKN